MESLLKQWEGEQVIIRLDRPTGAWILVAFHSTSPGPPVSGGTRMKTYPSVEAALQDAFNLSAAMTAKLALAGLAHGGGKAVIAVPPELDGAARPDLLRRYGTLLQQLGGMFLTGPDLGTSSADMDIVAETGAPYVFSCTPAAGGAGDSGPGTAIGILAAIRVTSEWLFGTNVLAGKRVLVQGAGSVGRALIGLLREAEAEILFSEVDPVAIRELSHEPDLQFVPPQDVYQTPCDVFSPCAGGGVLGPETIDRLNCLAVVGAANNQLLSPADAERLRRRKILYAPDIAINIGGLLSIVGMEAEGWSKAEAWQRVSTTVDQTLRQVYALATAEDIDTHAAAVRLAERRRSGVETGD
jgi:leucine dehydrogenase